MRKSFFLAAATLAFAAALPAHAAGVVQVSFVNTDRYDDAGPAPWDVKRCTEALGEHLKSLGATLPDGQVLKVEVTNIDLAGEVRHVRSRGEVRVLRGRADWPRIELSYTLEQGGRTLQSGQARLTDMAYMQNPIGLDRGGEFVYERHMLTRWVADLNSPKSAH